MLFQPVISINYSILVLNISAFTISFTTDSHFSVKSMYLVVAEVVILNNISEPLNFHDMQQTNTQA